jgi:hypothetical protein
LISVSTIVFAESNSGVFVLNGRIKPEITRSKKSIVTAISKYQIQTWNFIQKHEFASVVKTTNHEAFQTGRFDRFQARKAGWRKTK